MDSQDSETSSLVQKPDRQTCFYFSKFLNEHPLVAEVFSGCFSGLLILHFWVSVYLLKQRSVREALLPVFVLFLEVTGLCVSVLVVFFSDVVKRRIRGLTLWQREALGRVIRNLVVSSTLAYSSYSLWSSIESPRFALVPLLVVNSFAIVKFCLVRSSYALVWLVGCLLLEAQFVLFYFTELNWILKLLPLSLLSVNLTVFLCVQLIRNIKELRSLVAVMLGILGSSLLGVSFVLLSLSLEDRSDFQKFYLCLVFGMVCSSCALVKPLKELLLDLLFGHLSQEVIEI